MILNRLSEYLVNGKYEEFDKLFSSPDAQKYAKPFNLDYLSLNRKLLSGNKKEIDEAFARFDQVHMNTSQKVAVWQRAYYYYLSAENTENAKKYYEKLSSIIKYNGKEKADITYDIYINKGAKYLDKVLKLEHNSSGGAKYEYDALLADIYRNMEDVQNSEKYRKLVEEAMK